MDVRSEDMKEILNERNYLLYVELPNLINRIMKLDFANPCIDTKVAELTANEIKKVSNTEVDSALETIKNSYLI